MAGRCSEGCFRVWRRLVPQVSRRTGGGRRAVAGGRRGECALRRGWGTKYGSTESLALGPSHFHACAVQCSPASAGSASGVVVESDGVVSACGSSGRVAVGRSAASWCLHVVALDEWQLAEAQLASAPTAVAGLKFLCMIIFVLRRASLEQRRRGVLGASPVLGGGQEFGT